MIEASWGWNRPKILFWVDVLMHFWTCWHQDGEKDGQDGNQEAQDGRWKAKTVLQMDTSNFGCCDEQGAGSFKGLKVLIELMHKRKSLIARRVP